FANVQASPLRKPTKDRVCTCSTSPKSALVRQRSLFLPPAEKRVCTFLLSAIWKIACERNSISLQRQSESSSGISQERAEEHDQRDQLPNMRARWRGAHRLAKDTSRRN